MPNFNSCFILNWLLCFPWKWPITDQNMLKAWRFKYKIAYWTTCAFCWIYRIELSKNAWKWVTLSLQNWYRTLVESTESVETLHFSSSQWKFSGVTYQPAEKLHSRKCLVSSTGKITPLCITHDAIFSCISWIMGKTSHNHKCILLAVLSETADLP